MRLFIYLSDVLGREMLDSQGHFLGKIIDVPMRQGEEVFPRAEGFIIKKGLLHKQYALVPIEQVKRISRRVRLNVDSSQVRYQKEPFQPDFLLCRDILDQQIVDTNNQKVVRVNDVHLLTVDNQIYLAHVDVGLKGLMRRLGLTSLVDAIVRFFKPDSAYLKEEELISWKHTQVLTMGRMRNVLKSDIVRQKLGVIPTMELADIMEDLNLFEKLSLFKTFSTDVQRKIFADLAPVEKVELIEQLSDTEASNLLENIPSDEATDLLHDLPKEKVKDLMRFMHSEKSKKLRTLLGFEENSAGGLMTMEYLSLGKDAKVQDAIQKVKDSVQQTGNIFFIHILDENNHLLGVTSIRQFINEAPEKPLMETCYPKKVFVHTDDDLEEVALLLEKYKISSIPVLDEEEVMQGIITIDDVMEELISLAWKKYKDQI
ncbi:MAG: magnesium transporter [Candidatus Omnitrophica bacterium]|nr:magnesium transporter [Candidatus Omnitrophota bacterium]